MAASRKWAAAVSEVSSSSSSFCSAVADERFVAAVRELLLLDGLAKPKKESAVADGGVRIPLLPDLAGGAAALLAGFSSSTKDLKVAEGVLSSFLFRHLTAKRIERRCQTLASMLGRELSQCLQLLVSPAI